MTELLQADAAGIARATILLRDGQLVAFGTETVYGLGADATNNRAVAGIFAAKERPRFNPLICHYADTEAAFSEVVETTLAGRLASRFWPGPLTLILTRRKDCRVSRLASAGLDTLAIRVPAQHAAQLLLRDLGLPVAAPSANRFGHVSPTTAQHVLNELSGRIAAVVDSGSCPVGVESTVLDVSTETATLLRPGGITLEAIEAVIGTVNSGGTTTRPEAYRSPGMLQTHYAPQTRVRLAATSVHDDEALLAFGRPLTGACLAYNLSEQSDLVEAASRLFVGLRFLDQASPACIAVMPIPTHGLGRAINDRLSRAASPRIAPGHCSEDDRAISHG
jgi:L-threonylcarbamoyladenylate synthase